MHVTADVAMKYFFAQPIPGTIVYVSNFYMTMIVFLPLASAELRNQHVFVDLWPEQAPRWLDMLGLRFNWALSSAIYFLLAWNTLKDAMRKQAEGEYVLDQSGLVITWPSYYVLPFGFVVIGALLAAKIVKPRLALTADKAQTNG
nr:TRAP transporter small permease [Pseudohoeflea sp. DP4N28-3]